MIVRIDYPEPSVRLDLWGGVSGAFAGLDQFNRIIDQRWQNNASTTPTDIDRYQYGYDQNSNRLWKANVVGTPIVTGGLDEFYTYDPLNRLTDMQRGVLNGTKTGITGTPAVEQGWTLDPMGNWSGFATKASGTTDLNQTRTSNKVNEITNITESTGPTWIVPAYDAAGNTTTMPQVTDPTQNFTAVYDAWNRMVSISDTAGTVATYAYDGRNRRIIKVTASSSETRHFYFTNAWQDIEERVGTSTSIDMQYVWGLRYVDELVCRDDITPQRLYACQDANFNLTAIADIGGAMLERYLFDPYGVRRIMDASWAVTSVSSYNWMIGHQGLLHDEQCGLICNRARIHNPILGSFMQRDPSGGTYADDINLYQYVKASPVRFVDPWGLKASLGATPPTTQCVCYCVKHPGDCYLEYAEDNGHIVSLGTQNAHGIYQQFTYSYKVSLKSKSNNSLEGCNLHQGATSTYTYLNAADAKKQTATDYPNSDNTTKLTSTVKGNVVITKNPDDYVKAGLELTDTPSMFASDPNGSKNIVIRYQFTGNDYVEEAPKISGSIDMSVTFNIAKVKFSWSVNSSDGKIKAAGHRG